ncbi:hypothetical protein [uncultured Cohaesibacter sp.]|uniref:hypothetical protein n=1 Tax=uncultured Cohaesibacter sp. TaxID=1002546 RepID=UPI002AA8EF17|nr:hypothetical protein [uncultured Cohaesibacter sp.]
MSVDIETGLNLSSIFKAYRHFAALIFERLGKVGFVALHIHQWRAREALQLAGRAVAPRFALADRRAGPLRDRSLSEC